jgi:hypothetical protein
MKRTPRFTCDSGGITAPCDLYRPRRHARPRPVTATSDSFGFGLTIDAVDQGWGAWSGDLSDRSAA